MPYKLPVALIAPASPIVTQIAAAALAPARPQSFQPNPAMTGHSREPDNHDM